MNRLEFETAVKAAFREGYARGFVTTSNGYNFEHSYDSVQDMVNDNELGMIISRHANNFMKELSTQGLALVDGPEPAEMEMNERSIEVPVEGVQDREGPGEEAGEAAQGIARRIIQNYTSNELTRAREAIINDRLEGAEAFDRNDHE